jgi:hypothetical protein
MAITRHRRAKRTKIIWQVTATEATISSAAAMPDRRLRRPMARRRGLPPCCAGRVA